MFDLQTESETGTNNVASRPVYSVEICGFGRRREALLGAFGPGALQFATGGNRK